MLKIYLNNNENRTPSYLYRVIRFEHLIDLFQTSRFHLSSPNSWEDPFEQFWSKVIFKNLGSQDKFLDKIFGSCFTLQARSDAMWKIYSQNCNGVRIKIRFDELVRQVNQTPELRDAKVILGEVNYFSDAKLVSVANHLIRDRELLLSGDEPCSAHAWLHKRIAFQHERELRLLAILPAGPSAVGSTQISVDPHSLISSIHIDPRASPEAFKIAKDEIRRLCRFTGPIRHSALLRLPRSLREMLGSG